MYHYNLTDHDGNFKFYFRATLHNSVLFVVVADVDSKIAYAGSTFLKDCSSDDFMARINGASCDVRFGAMNKNGMTQFIVSAWLDVAVNTTDGERDRTASVNVVPVYMA